MLAAKDIMIKDPLYCSPEDSLEKVNKFMCRHQVAHLPVVEKNNVIGVVALKDILNSSLESNFDLDVLKKMLVRDVMTDPMVVKENTKFKDLVRRMLKKGAECVQVVDDESHLVGVMGRKEILEGTMIAIKDYE